MNGFPHADWQTRRNRFNHDWLKNKFLLSLDRFLKIVDGRIEDEAFAARFLAGGLVEWQQEFSGAVRLIESFEAEMSPRVLFDRPPLDGCAQQRDWLPKLVHQLWRARVRAAELVTHAQARAAHANDCYELLQNCLRTHSGTVSSERLRCCRGEFVAFRDACRELSKAFERFPHRILVT